eukprot:5774636-Prymnesium_polylepis.2
MCSCEAKYPALYGPRRATHAAHAAQGRVLVIQLCWSRVSASCGAGYRVARSRVKAPKAQFPAALPEELRAYRPTQAEAPPHFAGFAGATARAALSRLPCAKLVVQLSCELVRPLVVWAAVHVERIVTLGQGEAHAALEEDAILAFGDAEDLGGRRRLEVRHTPCGSPLLNFLVELPLADPSFCDYLFDHILGELPMHLGIWEEQHDRLCTRDRAKQLFDAIDFLEVDGHGKNKHAARVVDAFRAGARNQIVDIEEHVQAWADLTATLLDELAHILPQRPCVCRKTGWNACAFTRVCVFVWSAGFRRV